MYILFTKTLHRCQDPCTKSISGPCSIDRTQNDLEVDALQLEGAENPPPTPDVQEETNMAFVDNDSNVETIAQRELPGIQDIYEPDLDLASFMSRPLLIDTLTWTYGTSWSASFLPWKLFLQNKRVSNRLTNYRFLRGNMHLKFVVNGTAFHWGRALVDYLPCIGMTESTINRLAKQEESLYGKMVGSQRLHTFIDPCTSEAGELTLPFIFPLPFMDLTAAGEADKMGSILVQSLMDLSHASSSSSVDIFVYAWMTDVKLAGLTQTNAIGLSPQGGKAHGKEEQPAETAQGIISGPATMIAKAADVAARVPVIGPYATALGSMAKMAGSVAGALGYSKPKDVKIPDIQRVKIEACGSMANVEGPDYSRSLALTSDQRVSVDPSPLGLSGEDEMSFESIYSKSTYIGRFMWSPTDGSYTKLLTLPITLGMYRHGQSDASGKPQVIPTAASYLARAFRFWRGDTRLHFQVVGNHFHRGRLLCVWDAAGVNTDPLTETNLNKSVVFDIGDARDFVIDVGWGVSRPFLRVRDDEEVFNTSGLSIFGPDFDNGVLSIYVLTPLVTPGGTLDTISVNVFHSMKSLELGAPDSSATNSTSYFPKLTAAREVLKPEGATVEHSIVPHSDFPTVDTCFGETIGSVRAMVKRYGYRTIRGNNTPISGGIKKISINGNRYSFIRGYDPIAQEAIGADSVTACGNPWIDYFSHCYGYTRGSIRFKLARLSGSTPTTFFLLERGSYNNSVTAVASGLTGTSFVSQRALRQEDDGSTGGSHVFPAITYLQTSYEFELPYNTYLMGLGPHSSSYTAVSNSNGWRFSCLASATTDFAFEEYVAAGDDFSLFVWLGAPCFWMHELAAPVIG